MSEETNLHLVLVVRWMEFADGARAWWKEAGRLDEILLAVQETVFPDVAFKLKLESGGKQLKFDRLSDAARELSSAGAATYRMVGADPRRLRHFNLFVKEENLAVELAAVVGPGERRPDLGDFSRLAVALNDIGLRHGTVGPTFMLRWLNPDYPRPLPPRDTPGLPPGTLALYLSAAYHSEQPPARQATFALLRDTPLPEGVVRRQAGDLLLIQAAESLAPRETLESQLYRLEVWLGKTLGAAPDKDFRPGGDKRTPIWSKEILKPFSFYDASTRVGYKVVAENRDGDPDAETWEELAEVLPLRALSDGRPVNSTRVIFVEREAALRHLPRIRQMRREGVLYLGEDGDMWDPDPPGRWIRTDWEEA